MLHRAFCGNAAFRGCKTGSHRRGFWEYDMAGAAADVWLRVKKNRPEVVSLPACAFSDAGACQISLSKMML
jgi:hypothetical protein